MIRPGPGARPGPGWSGGGDPNAALSQFFRAGVRSAALSSEHGLKLRACGGRSRGGRGSAGDSRSLDLRRSRPSPAAAGAASASESPATEGSGWASGGRRPRAALQTKPANAHWPLEGHRGPWPGRDA